MNKSSSALTRFDRRKLGAAKKKSSIPDADADSSSDDDSDDDEKAREKKRRKMEKRAERKRRKEEKARKKQEKAKRAKETVTSGRSKRATAGKTGDAREAAVREQRKKVSVVCCDQYLINHNSRISKPPNRPLPPSSPPSGWQRVRGLVR